ncbi:MAG: Ig domain-containing protein [Methanomicrobiaceae archaeon]|nr:Ig domain-containing protein [Methanomicrobiaceae archaeon]
MAISDLRLDVVLSDQHTTSVNGKTVSTSDKIAFKIDAQGGGYVDIVVTTPSGGQITSFGGANLAGLYISSTRVYTDSIRGPCVLTNVPEGTYVAVAKSGDVRSNYVSFSVKKQEPLSVAEWMAQHTDSDGVVRTYPSDPPIWKQEFQYPQWIWAFDADIGKYQRVLPINLVWKNANLQLVKKVMQERDEEWKEVATWGEVPVAHRLDIYENGNWMHWDPSFNMVNGLWDPASNPLGRDHLEMYQVSGDNVVGNAHHDTWVLDYSSDEGFGHKGIKLEETEKKIRDYFLRPLWELSSYPHCNVLADPPTDGWTSVLKYNPNNLPNPEIYTEVSVACPVELYAYDSSGNPVASKDYQISGSYYYPKTDYEPQRIFIFGNTEGYNFEIIANEEDPEFIDGGDNSFTLSVVESTEEGFKKIGYEDVKITENSVASIVTGEFGANTVLFVDEEGDGSVKMVLPDTLIDSYQAIINHAPTIDPIADQEVIAGNEVAFTITYQDEDEDSLTTAFTSTLPNGDEITGLPEGATFDGEVFSWTPALSQGGTYDFEFEVSDGGLKETASFTIEVIVPAMIDIDPDTLNLKSNGPYITTYIELPECYAPATVDTLSCCLDCAHGHFEALADAPCCAGDYDSDGIADMMVKFDRETLVAEFAVVDFESDGKFANVAMTLSGRMNDGTRFVGEDTIQVRI